MSAAQRELVIVSDFLPDYQIALERSGLSTYVKTIVARFAARGWRITWLLLRPRITNLAIDEARLPYRLVSPAMRSVRGRAVLVSPVAIATTLAYWLFDLLPKPLRAAVERARLSLRRARGFSHVLGAFLSPAERRFVQRYTQRAQPDVVLYDSIFNYCEGVRARSGWIITHDVKIQRAESLRARGFEVRPHGFSSETEHAVLCAARNLIAIQRDDAAAFRRIVPSARVVELPMAIDVGVPPRAPRRPGRCVLVASGTLPNVDGIGWFFASCWDEIRARVPHAHLEIYGTICLRLASVPQNVTLRGTRHELPEIFAGATVAIAPLLAGSGLKLKVVEAMAYGVPMVTTSIGAQGLLSIEPRPFVVANDPREFADAVTRLLTDDDEHAALVRAARAAAPCFSADHVFAPLEAAIAGDLGASGASEAAGERTAVMAASAR
jgi:glycosyltransferase involved in cell wall biosynthesis